MQANSKSTPPGDFVPHLSICSKGDTTQHLVLLKRIVPG